MRKLLLLVGALILVVMLPATLRRELTVSRSHSDLIDKRIFAYRDWQSTGVRVNQGDRLRLRRRANGSTRPQSITGRRATPSSRRPTSTPFPTVLAARSSDGSANTDSASPSASAQLYRRGKTAFSTCASTTTC